MLCEPIPSLFNPGHFAAIPMQNPGTDLPLALGPGNASKNKDLHSSAPESCPVALLMIDVINDLEFEGGDKVLRQALPMAKRLAALAKRARAAGIPVIYANDNFGSGGTIFG